MIIIKSIWKNNKGKDIQIVIIDSGIEKCHPKLKNFTFKGISIRNGVISNNIDDSIGHGTAVTYSIKKLVPEANIFIIKLFDKEFRTTTTDLISALRYIDAKLQPNIIHLSNGVTICDDLFELKNICNKLSNKGVIIVAAFDNGGSISYPASFKNVIGVDFSIDYTKICDFQFIEGNVVNIRAIGKEQRLPWIPGTYKTVSGASFSAPYITAYVAQIMEDGIKDFNGILNELKKAAIHVTIPPRFNPIEKSFKISKAVAFPFNKEIHSIVRFSDMLNFKLEDVYDHRLLCNIEKNVSDLIGPTFDNKFYIKNIDKLDWKKDFDTLILGHVNQLSNVLERDLLYELLKKCKEYKKNIYAFDNLNKYEALIDEMKRKGIKVFYPKFIENYIPKGTFGKLKRISQPVLGVFGTSPKQGKYTLQLILRKLFIKTGYSVGQLGTEPSALLFGFDEVFPMGYGSTVNTFGAKSVEAINYLMGRIQDKNPDIILVGSQSQTIPLTYGNIGFYPPSYEFILGCEPDAYILCVNINDDVNYIDRTIKYLESVVPAKVLALVIFPFYRNLKWSVLGNSFKRVDEITLESRCKELSSIFKKNVFILNRMDEMKHLFEECVNYFVQ